MIHCIDQIQVSISERLDHLAALLSDSELLPVILKDEDKRRNVIRNFRIIKSAEKVRVANELRYLKQMERLNYTLSKPEIIACESMLANCINQYLNSDYEVRKSGQPNDLLDLFLFYYQQVNAKAKTAQLTIIKNCMLLPEVPFMHENLTFLLGNISTSLTHVYEVEKNRFFSFSKGEQRSLSPQKKEEEEDEKFDTTGKNSTKSKRKLQLYCFQLSKMLDLENLYVNYFYFNSMDTEKRKKSLTSNFLKRNLHIKRVMTTYEGHYLRRSGIGNDSRQGMK